MDYVLVEDKELALDSEGSLPLDSLKSQFGAIATNLYYIRDEGRECCLLMTDGKIVKPNSGWPMNGLLVSRMGPTSINEATIMPVKKTLTKRDLCKIRLSSPTANLALKNINILNETIRHKVANTQFFGSGGFSKCEGTSNEDAIKNQGLRNRIISSEEVSSLYQTYTLENGDIAIIDRHHASQ